MGAWPGRVECVPAHPPDSAELSTVRVAVVDGGIDPLSPDLEGRVVVRKSFVPDGELRESLHGTMVAGVIAATTDNAAGFRLNRSERRADGSPGRAPECHDRAGR